MARENPIRSLIGHGVVVIGGRAGVVASADEAKPNNPLIPFYFYVTRKTKTGQGLSLEEAISREQALRIFTVNPAIATFQDKTKGQIARGMLADFVILDQDLMTVPDDRILATHPLATFVGGREVYAAPGARF
jgi:predicted amidohydrolase YtcJ